MTGFDIEWDAAAEQVPRCWYLKVLSMYELIWVLTSLTGVNRARSGPGNRASG